MVFKVPASKASKLKKNQFEFEVDGATYAVPLLRYVSGEAIEAMRDSLTGGGTSISEMAARYSVFGPVTSETGRAVRTLDDEQMDALLGAYIEASKVSPGESEGS